jgi:cytoskeletal protein RodZ
VVPLAGQSGELSPLPQSVHYTQSEPMRRARVSPWLVGLVILAAMSAGAAGALALDYYRNHKQEETQAAIQSSEAAVAPETSDAQPLKNPSEENRKVESPAATTNSNGAEHSSSPAPNASTTEAVVISNEKSAEPVAPTKSPAPRPEHASREERKPDVKQPDERQPDAREARHERQREVTNEEGSDDPNIRARARRQRHPRDMEIRPDDVPPQLKRTTQELHRIREIFEGTRP